MKLGVNIDHVATLRQARYRGVAWGEPDPVEAAKLCVNAGAHSITLHLREDRRHIQDRDVHAVRESIPTRLNFEMSLAPEIVDFALTLKPDIVCLVPERRQELTTEGGLDVLEHEKRIHQTAQRLTDAGIQVSLFISPNLPQVEAAARVGAQCVELHTGAFAEQFRSGSSAPVELERLVQAAQHAHKAGLQVNAGHGLDYQNVSQLFAVPHLLELNIGHSIVSRAIAVGLPAAVRQMLDLIGRYPG